MARATDQLILHSLAREHLQVIHLLDLMRLNLDSLKNRPSAQSTLNIQRILDYLGYQIAGQHCRKEDVIFCAVRDIGCPDSISWGNLENEHQQIGALIRKAGALLGKPPESSLESTDNRRFNALYTLITVLHNHIKIEEKIWFPAAREYLSLADWERVMRTIRALQEELKSTARRGEGAFSPAREYQRILVSARPPQVQSY